MFFDLGFHVGVDVHVGVAVCFVFEFDVDAGCESAVGLWIEY